MQQKLWKYAYTLNHLKHQTIEPNVQKKYDNTKKIINEIELRWVLCKNARVAIQDKKLRL